MASSKSPLFKVGDNVRFKEGAVDWTVAKVMDPMRLGEKQLVEVVSGMTGRRLSTTNEHIIHRSEAVHE